MNLADEIDLRVLDVASKVTFGAVDQVRSARRWWSRRFAELDAYRIRNPALFDELAVVMAAGLMELLARWLGPPKR